MSVFEKVGWCTIGWYRFLVYVTNNDVESDDDSFWSFLRKINVCNIVDRCVNSRWKSWLLQTYYLWLVAFLRGWETWPEPLPCDFLDDLWNNDLFSRPVTRLFCKWWLAWGTPDAFHSPSPSPSIVHTYLKETQPPYRPHAGHGPDSLSYFSNSAGRRAVFYIFGNIILRNQV